MTDPLEVSAADVRRYHEEVAERRERYALAIEAQGWHTEVERVREVAERARSFAAAIARLEEREKRYREALEEIVRMGDDGFNREDALQERARAALRARQEEVKER